MGDDSVPALPIETILRRACPRTAPCQGPGVAPGSGWPGLAGTIEAIGSFLSGRRGPGMPGSAQVFCDRISYWAGQLRAAGMPGGMDALRARPSLDLLLSIDSRPAPPAPESSPPQDGPARDADPARD